VIVEVQLQADRDKLLSWPVYVTTLRAKFACAAVLLVVAPDRDVETWARQPIELGHPGFRLMPIVIGFEDVPRVRDRAAASRLPELAMLSVMAHPELEIAEVAVDALSQLPEDRKRLYLDVILMALPAAIRRIGTRAGKRAARRVGMRVGTRGCEPRWSRSRAPSSRSCPLTTSPRSAPCPTSVS
jgi:hypothetical protein